MSEPKKLRRLLILLEKHNEKGFYPETDADFEEYFRDMAHRQPNYANKLTDKYKTDNKPKQTSANRYRSASKEFTKGEEEYTNVDGWGTEGTGAKAKADSAKLQQGLQRLANDYGVESPRAFTANLNPRISIPNQFDPGLGGRQEVLYKQGDPHRSQVTLKRDGKDHEGSLAHEVAHQNSMNFGAVDAEGGMKIADEPDLDKIGITSFGYGENSTKDFLKIHDSHKSPYGLLDNKALKGTLHDKVMNSPGNKQRPELKYALADAVSSILSDEINLLVADWDYVDDPVYGFKPEEMWARAFEEFSKLKQMPDDERFNKKTRQYRIMPETYNAIQRLMDTIKVKYGHTMTKRPGQQGPATA